MGAVEDAVDAAADFIRPLLGRRHSTESHHCRESVDATELVDKALEHLKAINAADLATDPDAPYDASLAGVVYGLLDLITSLGILPNLSAGVAFGQRPSSVLSTAITLGLNCSESSLQRILNVILPIQDQNNAGVQPLLSQRVLPDIISALAELSFSPANSAETRSEYAPIFRQVVLSTPTSRLLAILTTFLQQPLPPWLQPVLSKELATIPLRKQGIRHIIEFLSLAYLSQNSQKAEETSGPGHQVPISLEAVTQASVLLIRPPAGTSQGEWLQKIAPQLLSLVDGNEGKELTRAAGQIIASGILSKKSTGAPGTTGWTIFAVPILRDLCPRDVSQLDLQDRHRQAIVVEQKLNLALKRLSIIVDGHSHAGLLRRLINPVILSLWALLNYATASSALDKSWATLTRNILIRYMSIACDAREADSIARNLFWDGGPEWTFGPGSQGGVEIRRRRVDNEAASDVNVMNNIFIRLESLDIRVNHFVCLLADAKIPDDVAGQVFLKITERWLSLNQNERKNLTEYDDDPLVPLIDAKLSEAMATKFKEQYVKSPQHVMELMSQLIRNYVNNHQARANTEAKSSGLSRSQLQTMIPKDEIHQGTQHTSDDDIVQFAISILNTLVSAREFTWTSETHTTLGSVIIPLVYLSQVHPRFPMAPLISNSAHELLLLIQPLHTPTQPCASDFLASHRTTLKAALSELNSAEPPDRTWALKSLHKVIQNPTAFPVIDVPSVTYLIVNESLADPESYVHTAAIPVLYDLAVRAPNPVVSILVDAFVDIEEQSLKLGRGLQMEEQMKVLQAALDFRLRVGELLSNFVTEDGFWVESGDVMIKYHCIKRITDACLLLASRRGQRKQNLQSRMQIQDEERKIKEESEAAWDGPIPNLVDMKDDNPQDQADRDVLLEIVQGWHDTNIEEDVRIRTSALSVLSSVIERRMGFLKQATIDAAMQFVIFVLTMETSEARSILRRAAVLVVMGLLRSLAGLIESGKEQVIRLSSKQEEDLARVIGWVKDEDADALVRDHAVNVLEGLEALQFKKLHMAGKERFGFGPDFGLQGHLRGIGIELDDVRRHQDKPNKMIIEELE